MLLLTVLGSDLSKSGVYASIYAKNFAEGYANV